MLNNRRDRWIFVLAILFTISLYIISYLLGLLVGTNTQARVVTAPPINTEALTAQIRDGMNTTIEQQVKAAVDSFPRPRDGQNGRDGKDGKDGRDGRDGKDGQAAPVVICRAIELRQNPRTGKPEYRFVGDDLWLSKPKSGILPNTCGVQDAAGSL